jgi:hypothetical protein
MKPNVMIVNSSHGSQWERLCLYFPVRRDAAEIEVLFERGKKLSSVLKLAQWHSRF